MTGVQTCALPILLGFVGNIFFPDKASSKCFQAGGAYGGFYCGKACGKKDCGDQNAAGGGSFSAVFAQRNCIDAYSSDFMRRIFCGWSYLRDLCEYRKKYPQAIEALPGAVNGAGTFRVNIIRGVRQERTRGKGYVFQM